MNIPIEKLSRQQMSMIDMAIEMAEKSTLSFRVGSVLCYAGIKIIGNCNKHGDHIQDPYGSVHNVCAIHAEVGVCLEYYQRFKKDLKSFRDIKKLVLCVVRRNRCGSLKNAKPCMECTQYLKKWLPCKILYSTDEGFFYGKISELESEHLSYVQMKRRLAPNGRLSSTKNVLPNEYL
jgi:hypothetical protein